MHDMPWVNNSKRTKAELQGEAYARGIDYSGMEIAELRTAIQEDHNQRNAGTQQQQNQQPNQGQQQADPTQEPPQTQQTQQEPALANIQNHQVKGFVDRLDAGREGHIVLQDIARYYFIDTRDKHFYRLRNEVKEELERHRNAYAPPEVETIIQNWEQRQRDQRAQAAQAPAGSGSTWTPKTIFWMIVAAVLAFAIAALLVLGIANAAGWIGDDDNNGAPSGEPTEVMPTATAVPSDPTATPASGNNGSQSQNGNGTPDNSADGNNDSAGGNGETVTTSCDGPVEWGPAGPAPGAFTDDSAAQVAEAVQVMEAQGSAEHVTVHKFCAGDDTPNGWIVGSSWTESNGVRVSADFLPAGVCIDYDHNVTQINGEVYHTEQLNSRWSRTQLMGDGSAEGLKFTVYWTPCEFTDGTSSWDGNGAKPNPPQESNEPEATQEAVFSCTNLPESKEHLTQVFPNTSAESWTQHSQYPHGWIYNGPEVSLQWVEGVHHFDYDGGTTAVGENPPAGSAFTVWFCE